MNVPTAKFLLRTFLASSVILLTFAEIHRALERKWPIHKQTDVCSFDNSKNSPINAKEDVKCMESTAVYDRSLIWLYSVLSAMVVGLCGVFPLLIIPLEAGPTLRHGAGSTRLKLLLSFAVGSLLGDVFLHLLPETFQHSKTLDAHVSNGLWVITGILFFVTVEKAFGEGSSIEENENPPANNHKDEIFRGSDEHSKTSLLEKQQRSQLTSQPLRKRKPQCEKPILIQTESRCLSEKTNQQCIKNNNGDVICNTKRKVTTETTNNNIVVQSSVSSESTIMVSGYLNLFANVIDNFTHGLAIAGSYSVSQKMGVLTTIAILIHEVPHEISDFAILLRSGFNRMKAAKAQVATALGGMIGVTCALSAESVSSASHSTAWILPFTSGGFLYIALVTVTPDLLHERCLSESVKQVLCICGGIASMFLVTAVIG